MKSLADPAAERAVLSGICRYGYDAYLDCVDMINESTFTIDSNQVIFSCLKHLFDKNDRKVVDIPSVYSAANELGLEHIFDQKSEKLHLQAIFDFPVDLSNVRSFAGKISKLNVARLLKNQLKEAENKLTEVSGNETIAHILGIAEDSVFDFSSMLNVSDAEPTRLGEGAYEYLVGLGENPIDQIGLPTGFPEYDKAIGGGLRTGVNVMAARIKVGKTLLADNIGYYIADQLNVPVLNMDTEMESEDHLHRTIAMMTEAYIHDVETGKYYQKADKKQDVLNAAKKLADKPYYHKSIAGMPFEEQLAVMRRWLVKEVGLHDDGTAKDAVIIYDYLKLMTADGITHDLKEYQLLGFMMTSLHNFAVRYKVPILGFVQLNRDGITKESTDTASGSDRILWLCTNFTIFKKKSDEEIGEDGPEAGNRKLVPVVSRHGPCLDDGDYINCHMKGWCAKITEGERKFELSKIDKKDDGFIVDTNDDIPFE